MGEAEGLIMIDVVTYFGHFLCSLSSPFFLLFAYLEFEMKFSISDFYYCNYSKFRFENLKISQFF